MIRRVWTNAGYHGQSADLNLPDRGFYNPGNLPDTGYVYMGGLGSNCSQVEAGYQYSTANNWYTPYMRFGAGFGISGQVNATITCPGSRDDCVNNGLSRTPGDYYTTFQENSTLFNIGGSYYSQIQFFFDSYGGGLGRVNPADSLVINVDGPMFAGTNASWNGWDGLGTDTVMERQTNIAQGNGVNGAANEQFGYIDWSNAQVWGNGMQISWLNEACESWDGTVDNTNACGSASTGVIKVSYGDASNESDNIDPSVQF
ncbi:MAG: hypothetical protein JO359_01355 [Candidatus Eremiobacteraeota bacterium]|nr:hypothetical protein [Candidatus Eremiobacteraeota bacterium]